MDMVRCEGCGTVVMMAGFEEVQGDYAKPIKRYRIEVDRNPDGTPMLDPIGFEADLCTDCASQVVSQVLLNKGGEDGGNTGAAGQPEDIPA